MSRPCDLPPYWGTLGLGLLVAWFALANGWLPTFLLVTAAAVHEGGHALALRAAGGRVSGLRFSPVGAVMRTESLRLSYPGELMAVLAGPTVNLLCGAMLAAAARGRPLLYAAAGANLALGVFNLLPAAPLDGWRALQLLAEWKAGPRGERAVTMGGGAVSLIAAGGLVWLMLRSGGNLWLLPAAMGLALAGGRAAVS